MYYSSTGCPKYTLRIMGDYNFTSVSGDVELQLNKQNTFWHCTFSANTDMLKLYISLHSDSMFVYVYVSVCCSYQFHAVPML